MNNTFFVAHFILPPLLFSLPKFPFIKNKEAHSSTTKECSRLLTGRSPGSRLSNYCAFPEDDFQWHQAAFGTFYSNGLAVDFHHTSLNLLE